MPPTSDTQTTLVNEETTQAEDETTQNPGETTQGQDETTQAEGETTQSQDEVTTESPEQEPTTAEPEETTTGHMHHPGRTSRKFESSTSAPENTPEPTVRTTVPITDLSTSQPPARTTPQQQETTGNPTTAQSQFPIIGCISGLVSTQAVTSPVQPAQNPVTSQAPETQGTRVAVRTTTESNSNSTDSSQTTEGSNTTEEPSTDKSNGPVFDATTTAAPKVTTKRPWTKKPWTTKWPSTNKTWKSKTTTKK